MEFEEVFRNENAALLFRKETENGTFIAEAAGWFSGYMTRNDFSREWAWSFPAGRYVITVYQRHSFYCAGKQEWKNDAFRYETGHDSRYRTPCFVIALDQPQEYRIPSWKRTAVSFIVRSRIDPLQDEIFTDVIQAEKAARNWSEQGMKAAVLEWYEDYDMY